MKAIRKNTLRYILMLVTAGLIHGCSLQPVLIPTPNLISASGGYAKYAVERQFQTSAVDVLYVTDRVGEYGANDQLNYGAERSPSMAFGNAKVALGDDVSWPDLVALSQTQKRDRKLRYEISEVKEFGRFPPTPYPFNIVAGKPALLANVATKIQQSNDLLQTQLLSRLAKSKRKEVVLFIHGYNNSFDEAQFTIAGLWHFLGRQGVPVSYSWPAAHGGLFGYFIDRESGEYTIYHLKETLRLLFANPEIEKIHLIAHSRGTDVTTTALRELMIEERASGNIARETFKLENLILAAPDLDFGVISQRLMAEQFAAAIGQITIYTTQSDKALGFAQSLMSGVRLGRVKANNLTEDEKLIFSNVENVNIVESTSAGSFIGHSYFQQNPAVSSDLIRVIQTSARPGSAERPLIHLSGNFWRVPQDYLLSEGTN